MSSITIKALQDTCDELETINCLELDQVKIAAKGGGVHNVYNQTRKKNFTAVMNYLYSLAFLKQLRRNPHSKLSIKVT